MSIISIAVKTLAGALNLTKTNAEIRISKGVNAKVVMDGYIGAGRVKNDSGEYVASAYGRLPVQAALAGEGDKQRLVGEVAGGARFVLFKNTKKKDEKDPDYTGTFECGDVEFGLFGRKVKTEAGEFIALSSGEAQPKKAGGNSNGHSDHAANEQMDDHSSIPF